MEWLIMMDGGLSATATNLGHQEDLTYIISEECSEILEQMLGNIMQESKVKCQARRNIANSRLIQMDLIPILCNSGDDPEVFDAVVRLLMHLSMPLEVIIPIVKELTSEDLQKRHELQKMLETIKKEFTQHKVIYGLVSQMALIIEEAGSYPIDKTNAETLSNCLTLLRNVLYINYERYRVGSLKNDTIIENLFKCGFHDVLKELCQRSEGSKWLSSFLQVLQLMYKDTSSTKMVAYLRQGYEMEEEKKEAALRVGKAETATTAEERARCKACTPGSSSANPSQTSSNQFPPPDEDLEVVDDPPTPESVATSEEAMSISEAVSPLVIVSDDSQSSSSTLETSGSETSSQTLTLSRSSTPTLESDDSTLQEGSGGQSSGSYSSSSWSSETDSEKDGIKYLKRRNMKKLADFALDYVKHGMDNILIQCKNDLKTMISNHYFLWQLNFFLPFSALPSIAYTDVKITLSAPIFSQLVSASMQTWENFLQASTQRNNDSKSNSVFKILNMQMSTLRQMLNAIYKFTTRSDASVIANMKTVLATIALTKTVRNFYHLLIRKFKPQLQTLAFLREIVVGNDITLRIIDQLQQVHRPMWGQMDMVKHIQKFATRPIMRIYNYMLSKFSHNTQEENEVVMTMLHHVAVDVKRLEVLYQIPILTTFASLWEAGGNHITKQSHELIDYIIHEFCVLASSDKEKCLQTVAMLDNIRANKRKHGAEAKVNGKKPFSLGASQEVEGLFVPRDESDDEYDDPDTVELQKNHQSTSQKPLQDLSVEDCVKVLRKKGFGQEIKELQEVLLEICYFKLNSPKYHVGEPHIWHCCSDGKSVPIIAFTEKAEQAQGDAHFKALLLKLGLHTAQDTRHANASIPAFWTSDMSYTAASKLGDISDGDLKFKRDHLHSTVPDEYKDVVVGTTPHESGVLYDLEDLDIDSCRENNDTPTDAPSHFQLPTGMWFKVIEKANKQTVAGH